MVKQNIKKLHMQYQKHLEIINLYRMKSAMLVMIFLQGMQKRIYVIS